MQPTQIDTQAPAAGTIRIETDGDVVAARRIGREIAASLGFDKPDQALIATAISELARNILSYAGSGSVLVTPVRGPGQHGVQVIATDSGPGIENIELAMRDGFSSGSSLGLGLPGTKRIMDEFDLISEPGRGVSVTATKWKR